MARRRWLPDGPYGETKELFGGFYVIEVASKEEVVEWAQATRYRRQFRAFSLSAPWVSRCETPQRFQKVAYLHDPG